MLSEMRRARGVEQGAKSRGRGAGGMEQGAGSKERKAYNMQQNIRKPKLQSHILSREE